MKTVHTLICRGLSLSAATLLFACSGTQGLDQSTLDADTGHVGSPSDAGPSPAADLTVQDPERQDPVGEQRATALIQGGLERARRSMELKLYNDALRESAQVLELDPSNEDARRILIAAQEILGDDVARVTRSFQDKVLQARISIERTRFLARKAAERGDAQVGLGRYGDAIESYETALLNLRYNPNISAGNTLEREITAKRESARQKQAEALMDDRRAEQAKSQAQLDAAERRRRIEQDQRISRLLLQANRDFQLGNYRASLASLDRALVLDPNNGRALALQDLASRAHHENQVEISRQRWKAEWSRTFQDLRESNVPQFDPIVFDLDRWAEVDKRKPLSFTPTDDIESPEERAITAALNDTVIEHDFGSTAAVEDWTRYYAEALKEVDKGVNFVIDPSVRDLDEEATTLIDFRLPTMSVAKALNVISAKTGVKWTVRDGVVLLVSGDIPTGKTYLVPYEVRDLVQGVKNQPGPKLKLTVPGEDFLFDEGVDDEPAPTVVDDGRLQDLIRNNIDPDSWDEGTGSINFQSGVLLIRHTRDAHQKIQRLLADLRRAVGIQVDVEARFLKVEDNFLEDIGIDFRGLGDQSSEGLPGRGLENNNRSNLRFDDFGRPEQINTASPGEIGTGTEPGIFFDDGQDGDLLARTENLYDTTLGGGPEGLNASGGLSVQYAFLNDIELEVILRAVQKEERSEEIVAPRLLVYNNTRAHMQALRHTSYIRDFDVEIAQAAAVANPIVDVVRDGVVLDVRPVVSADRRFITMELRPTVMALQLPIPTFTTTLGAGQPVSIQLPNVQLQSVRTTVTMPDGGTLMLGGMKLSERQNQQSGIPLLKDLPGLSFFFSRKGTFVLNRKILILIRSRIVIPEEFEPTMIPDNYEALVQNN